MKPTRYVQHKELSLKFEAHPATGDLIRLTDAKSILQSIRELVLTSENELVGDLDIYGGLNRFLFKNKTTLTLLQVKGRIEEIIKLHEPRADLKSVEVYTDGDERHAIMVRVVFYALNIPTPFEETIRLNRVR